jgi:hypothetical protein
MVCLASVQLDARDSQLNRRGDLRKKVATN